MNQFRNKMPAALVAILMLANGAALAVGADEAAALKSSLTPMGAEKAGSKDGSIPAWSGAPTAGAGLNAAGQRLDPFAAEKPLFSINAKNMAQYAERLTDGTKALMRKYPDSYRVDVYKTHRTAIAPQWVYDNVAKNALNAKLVDGGAGPMPQGAYGGIPFPIPKSGVEVMWNHLLRWRGEAWHWEFTAYQGTPDGQWVNVSDSSNDHTMPYYAQGRADKFGGEYWLVRSLIKGPAIRAGEAITARTNVDESKTVAWVYLTGQRRVRKLPNACCDTPSPFSAGVASFDEVEVFSTRMDRFDWKLLGKKEIYIPYNSNRTLGVAKDRDVLGARHLNPDHVRWELHRVWVVEATLKPGQRHTAPKSRYYIDEDSWIAVTADRFDANGQLTRVPFALPAVMSDVSATVGVTWGVYDLTAGSSFVNGLVNERKAAYKPVPAHKDAVFTPDAMSGEGVR